MSKVGILAFGSLINDPGPEIGPKIVMRIKCQTPFGVEYGRYSKKTRGGAPTLVPHEKGAPVNAEILVLDDSISEDEARDMLWRRETRTKDAAKKYPAGTGENSVLVEVNRETPCVVSVLYTNFNSSAKIPNPNPVDLARAAIESVKKADEGMDGITYLMDAIAHGIQTPLTERYKDEVLKKTGAGSLSKALETAAME